MHLGIALSEVEDGSQRVIFYYTDPGTRGGTQEAASFKMGDLTGRWARFTLTVQGAEVGVMCSLHFVWVKEVCHFKRWLDLLISTLRLNLGDNRVNFGTAMFTVILLRHKHDYNPDSKGVGTLCIT